MSYTFNTCVKAVHSIALRTHSLRLQGVFQAFIKAKLMDAAKTIVGFDFYNIS